MMSEKQLILEYDSSTMANLKYKKVSKNYLMIIDNFSFELYQIHISLHRLILYIHCVHTKY